jgi:hypothetical protein
VETFDGRKPETIAVFRDAETGIETPLTTAMYPSDEKTAQDDQKPEVLHATVHQSGTALKSAPKPRVQ